MNPIRNKRRFLDLVFIAQNIRMIRSVTIILIEIKLLPTKLHCPSKLLFVKDGRREADQRRLLETSMIF